MLESHALLCVHASGVPLLLRDNTDAYATRQKNNNDYVLHMSLLVNINNN